MRLEHTYSNIKAGHSISTIFPFADIKNAKCLMFNAIVIDKSIMDAASITSFNLLFDGEYQFVRPITFNGSFGQNLFHIDFKNLMIFFKNSSEFDIDVIVSIDCESYC